MIGGMVAVSVLVGRGVRVGFGVVDSVGVGLVVGVGEGLFVDGKSIGFLMDWSIVADGLLLMASGLWI